MKKYLMLLSLFLAATAIMPTLTSCGGDDDDEEGYNYVGGFENDNTGDANGGNTGGGNTGGSAEGDNGSDNGSDNDSDNGSDNGGTESGEETGGNTNTPSYNDHEYVDLGLPSGLKWATCNVGASKPEDYGNYYAWGETSTKSTYKGSNSSWYGKSNSQLESAGVIDCNGNLTAKYDAATVNWGGDWRMPTQEEILELLNNCTATWTTLNGVNGYKFTSKNNSKYIFLPAVGIRNDSSLYGAGSRGRYWSATPNGSSSNNSYGLDFNSSDVSVDLNGRYYGRSVRAVSE